ncbi:MAG: sigma-70 family RNA polymerase sigma factor [Bacteroidota bacterium]|nr:sigma-70 family RNA polymerase sigma factor [Bacteroidota bacterium]
MYSDFEIVEGCLKNEKKFQEILYKNYAPKMFGICLRYASDRDMANDLLQEGFIKIFNALNTFKFQSSLNSWMYQIIVRNSINYVTRKIKFHDDIDTLNPRFEPIEEVDEQEKNHWLNHISRDEALLMIQDLPEKYRLVMNMYAIDQMSHSDISEFLGITESSSRSQLSRARKLLTEALRIKLKQKIAG